MELEIEQAKAEQRYSLKNSPEPTPKMQAISAEPKKRHRWRKEALPRTRYINCPICKKKFHTGINSTKVMMFSFHLKACIKNTGSSETKTTLKCSICKKDQTYKDKNNEDIIRLFLVHVVLCRDHDVPHIWRHHIMKCNLCPESDSVFMTYPEFATHIVDRHSPKYVCTKCPTREFKTALECFKEHWSEEHAESIETVEMEDRYNETVSIVPEVPWFCPCKERFEDEESRDQHQKICEAKVQSNIRYGRTPANACSTCDVSYHCGEELVMHKVITHKDVNVGLKQSVCGICSLSFRTIYEMKKHIRMKHKLHPEAHKKESDGDLETSTNHFKKQVSDAEVFPCTPCDNVFKSATGLQSHDGFVHKRLQQLICEECGKVFSGKPPWKRHMRRVHGIDLDADGKKFVCPDPECDSIFRTRSGLEKHRIWNHSNLDTCLNCGRRFWLPLALKKHIIMCTPQEDKTKCLRCDLRFVSKNLLLKHNVEKHELEIGTIEEPDPDQPEIHIPIKFYCDFCNGREFETEGGLLGHIEQIHRDAASGKQWICEFCSKSYPYRKALAMHIIRIHKRGGLQRNQSKSDKPFLSEKGLQHRQNSVCGTRRYGKKKEDTEPKIYFCDQCSKTYDTELKWRRHTRQVHGDGTVKYMCDQCDKTFFRIDGLKAHQARMHVDPKLRPKVMCGICEKTFNSKCAMRFHRRQKHPESPIDPGLRVKKSNKD